MTVQRRLWTRLVLTGAALALSGALAAQTPLATYTGADRTQKLIEGAKKEGEVVIYTSAPVDDMKALTDAFEKKYGVKAKVWRASSEKVLQRVVTEAKSGRHDVDIAETNGPEMEAMVREKALQPVKSSSHADLIPQAVFPHSSWVGTRLNIFALAYNTKLVKKEELPKTWEDLADPKWKGRLGIEAEDADWFSGVIGTLGEDKGVKTFRDIVQKNGISVRKGHTLLLNLVVSGEVPLALTVYNYKAEQLKNKGAPVDWFTINPAIARANGIGVATQPKNPNAALLFYEFEVSEEGQRILFERDFVPTNRKIETKLNKMPIRFVDPKVALDEFQKWEKLYNEIFNQQAK
jgi:iron(III) transport system substrate-binding protein